MAKMRGQIQSREGVMTKKGKIFVVLLMFWSVGVSCGTPGPKLPGQMFGDAAITMKIKANLFDESLLRCLAISVQAFYGDVTLIGSVENEEQRKQAEVLAKSVEGVVRVNNLLEVKLK